jgi:type II secretory pathway predicted ATPase ExeA
LKPATADTPVLPNANENHIEASAPQVEKVEKVLEPVKQRENGNGALIFSVLPVLEDAGVEKAGLPENDADPANAGGQIEEGSTEKEIPHPLFISRSKESEPTPGFLTYYGLSQQPFDVTPDPGYLYLSRVHREALTSLSEGIQNFRGFMVLVAEPGLGKTTVLNKLMEEFRDSSRIVFLFQTQCTSGELLRYLLSELGVENPGTDVVAMHKRLNDILFQEMLQGRRFVLIVDEAQNLDDSVLETIRLLSNFETTHSKLIQIVLAGQPELVDTLMRPSLSQLRQRISIMTNLEPLGVTETAEYIKHRLRAAGFDGGSIFTPEALEMIAERSAGVPRCINNLCFNILLSGYSHRQEIIDSKIVERAAARLELERLVQRPQRQPDEEKPKQGFALTGKLTEKLTNQNWGKKNEFRIQVSLEREYPTSLPIADHYYSRSFYVSEEQATGLREGKPVRIKFEQD